MKGYIYHGPGSISREDLTLKPCGDNDIIIKNICSGICGTDVSAWKHGGNAVRIYPGCEFGHEMVSRVVEVGKNVQGLKPGDRVYPYPMTCTGDRSRSSTVGGFSEYIHVPECRLNYSVFKVDDVISDHSAAMIEPFTVGGHAAMLSEPGSEKNAVIFGTGIIGMAAAITLKYMGCDKIMLVNRSAYRLEKAAELGFETCSPVQEDVREKAIQIFGESFGVMGKAPNVDIYIDASGSADSIDYFLKMGKLNALLTIVALHYTPRSINLLPLIYASQRIQGSGGYNFEDVNRAIEILASGQFNTDRLISHVYAPEQLEEAIQKAGISSESMKVVIEYPEI